MSKPLLTAIMVTLSLVAGAMTPALPAWGWECQDDVDDLRKKIRDDDDRWSKKERDEALEHLRKAELKRINPAECREELIKARKALGLGDIIG